MTEAARTGQSAGRAQPYLQFKFNVVFTTKIDWSGPGDEGPSESPAPAYGRI